MSSPDQIRIPDSLLPRDGRFGSGPSKIRAEQLAALVADGASYLGTSHRQATVRAKVGEVRDGLRALFSLPEGYEVLLGNGGTTCFWDAATFHLVERAQPAPLLRRVLVEVRRERRGGAAPGGAPGDHERARHAPPGGGRPLVDPYALTHNETSTGVMMPIRRPEGADGLVVVDATSGGRRHCPSTPPQFDCYYFAPQKSFSSDGGLWLAICSPAGVERIESLAASDRWTPAFFDLKIALDNSRLNQTYNTPALATIHLLASQIAWMNDHGGLAFSRGPLSHLGRDPLLLGRGLETSRRPS